MPLMQRPELKGLQDILYGNITSVRHTLFQNANKRTDLLQLSSDCTTFFSTSMMRRFTNEVKSVLPEFWPDFNDSNSRMMSYVLHVLVPEALIYVVMVKEECSRQVAERLFWGHQTHQSEVTEDIDRETDEDND